MRINKWSSKSALFISQPLKRMAYDANKYCIFTFTYKFILFSTKREYDRWFCWCEMINQVMCHTISETYLRTYIYWWIEFICTRKKDRVYPTTTLSNYIGQWMQCSIAEAKQTTIRFIIWLKDSCEKASVGK